MRSTKLLPLLVGLCVGQLTDVRANDSDIDFFEKKIRPLLVQHCYECHSANAKKVGGGLLLDSRDGVKRGGESGAVVDPGKPEVGLLIKAIRYNDDSVKMPPKGKLPAASIADLEEWVRRGVPDPRDKPTSRKERSWDEVFRERTNWWSLQPVQQVPLPQPKNAGWSDQVIDRFVLAKLEENGLAPAANASPRTLARRLSLVLTGLPPSVVQASSVNYERLVDELLDSPHFGERWARHWLDVVRFTETHGNEWNYEVHHAWRYRDYLIRAFNADVPFDQFVFEHIAGDLLPQIRRAGGISSPVSGTTIDVAPTGGLTPPARQHTHVRQFVMRNHPTEHFNESVIGTGFFRFGEVNHDDCIGLPELGYDIADNQLDTLTKVFQATTVACARCHDHKLDAVSMHDYYALLGVIRSSRLVAHTIDSVDANAAIIKRLRDLKVELRRELATIWRRDAESFEKYMLAAEAKQAKRPDADQLAVGLDAKRLEKWVANLVAEKQPLEDLFEPWRATFRSADKSADWPKIAEQYGKEDRERAEFNRSQFETWADFRSAREYVAESLRDSATYWHIGGQGLRELHSPAGEFSLNADGDSLVKAVLPAGALTNAVSDKLNGTLRSPTIPLGKKNISFEVLGQRSSALRLVSNNCQLNYKNYKALIKPELSWTTFSPPEERDRLRTYAELMTMFDNPKFPDQLSALGGDSGNYRLPWDKAAENPRSYFGITRVVLHDCAESPKPELSHLRRLFESSSVTRNVSEDERSTKPPILSSVERSPSLTLRVTERYATAFSAAIDRWADGKATDDDARWLDAFVRRELLTNQAADSPKLNELTKQFRQAEAELALPRVVAGIGDGGPGFDQPVFARGDCRHPGETVPRRFLAALTSTIPESTKPFTPTGSGRLELAAQIANENNPLTARVFVNRVWHHLFGAGLVRTVDDFGHVGELPSHPELLDHLAAQFVKDGWSIKRLIRSIVLSRTFQMSSVPSAAGKELDPQNRWLSHYPARRLEAEAIRDAILATSGRLDRKLFGQSVYPFRDKEYADRRLFPGPLDGDGRRSVYIKNNLMESPKFLGAFNIPGGKVTQGRRDITNVPAQALALLNDPFVIQQADIWAAQLTARSDSSIAERIDSIFEISLGRPASEDERRRFEQVVMPIADLHQIPAAEVLKSQPVWKDVAHAVFNLKEFIYIP